MRGRAACGVKLHGGSACGRLDGHSLVTGAAIWASRWPRSAMVGCASAIATVEIGPTECVGRVTASKFYGVRLRDGSLNLYSISVAAHKRMNEALGTRAIPVVGEAPRIGQAGTVL